MAESGGHDPHSHEANEKFIGLAPTLWDSLSNHKFIIAFVRFLETDSQQKTRLLSELFDRLHTSAPPHYFHCYKFYPKMSISALQLT